MKKDELHSLIQEVINEILEEELLDEEGKKDACYHKVKSRYKVWPSAYASGALVKCRKVGAKNWGNSKKEGLQESDAAYTEEDLKELLRSIKGYDHDAYAQFASLFPFIIEEMSDTLGVVKVEEFADDDVPDIKIIFKDTEAAKSFMGILQNAGLTAFDRPGHYKMSKGMSKFKDHPKFHEKSLPSITFSADHYYKGLEDGLREAEITDDEREELEDVSKQLKGAVKAHGKQASTIDKALKKEAKKNCGCGMDPCKTYGIQEEKIPGGLGAELEGSMEEQHKQIADKHNVSVAEIEKELKKGLKIEMEHTTDKATAHEIAMDHLMEDPKYYSKLVKANLEEKKKKAGTESSKESSLRDWFGRKGAKGSKSGWVDCNAPDGKGGYKACGRESGESRKKYPSCRPTPGACKEKGKGKSWGKKAAKKESLDLTNESLRRIVLEETQEVLFKPGLLEHVRTKTPLHENIFRVGSSCYFKTIKQGRKFYKMGLYEAINEEERDMLENTDLGEWVMFEGEEVPLDFPMYIEEDKEKKPIGKPMKNTGGGKKYKVYVRDPKTGNIKTITYGDSKGGLKGNWNNPEARKSFASRHQCEKKKDRTKAGYWACRAHKDFGKNVPGRFW